MFCTVGFFLLMCVVLTASKDVLAYIFTSEKEVVDLVAYAMPAYIAFHLFEGLCATTSGVLRGTGRQKLGAIFNMLGYYAVGLPLGVVLLFVAKIGMIGFWLGMLICTLIPCICSVTYIIRMNWDQVAEEAQRRAKLSQKPVEDLNSAPTPGKAVSSSGMDGKAGFGGHTDAQNGVVLLSFTVIDGPSLQDKKAASVPRTGRVLTTKQLIVRRGLAVASAVGILAVGILIRIFTVDN